MHRALLTHDVLLEIFEYMAATAGQRMILKACARVCTTFCEPALSVLWRDIGNMMVLFQLLKPNFCLADETCYSLPSYREQYPYVLRGDISPARFARFQKYARYVRTVECRPACIPGIIDYTVFQQLHFLNHEQPLLPSLQEYCCALDLRLNNWFYEVGYPASHIEQNLQNLAVKAPFLNSLTLYGAGFRSDLTHLSAFKHLDSLNFGGSLFVLDFHLLRILAEMGQLRVLKADTVDLSLDFNVTLPVVVFQALECLSLSATTQQWIHLLSIISSPVLHTLSLHPTRDFTDVADIEDYRHSLDFLSSKYASFLHGLHLSFRLSRTPPLTTSRYRYILDPLLSFYHLRSISIIFHHSSSALSLSENDVHDFAKAWSEATDICLIFQCATPAPALSSLIHFARHCPNLRSLRLNALDFCAVPAVEQLHPFPLHHLTHLSITDDFWNSRHIPDPMAAARFLDTIFPHLEDDPLRDIEEWDFDGSRGAVNSHLRALRLARQH
ncbi:hypothetical protein A0H81_09451 [Grifola frondosa]|uniref:F-box domain-containing protein n=1 Tax=Grifola frondosa TaxID=5627 RepID=A0A1C7M1M1_GRIFR|nr:hypothetical protein A0H81_09451 [Grifola frondosa]